MFSWSSFFFVYHHSPFLSSSLYRYCSTPILILNPFLSRYILINQCSVFVCTRGWPWQRKGLYMCSFWEPPCLFLFWRWRLQHFIAATEIMAGMYTNTHAHSIYSRTPTDADEQWQNRRTKFFYTPASCSHNYIFMEGLTSIFRFSFFHHVHFLLPFCNFTSQVQHYWIFFSFLHKFILLY